MFLAVLPACPQWPLFYNWLPNYPQFSGFFTPMTLLLLHLVRNGLVFTPVVYWMTPYFGEYTFYLIGPYFWLGVGTYLSLQIGSAPPPGASSPISSQCAGLSASKQQNHSTVGLTQTFVFVLDSNKSCVSYPVLACHCLPHVGGRIYCLLRHCLSVCLVYNRGTLSHTLQAHRLDWDIGMRRVHLVLR